MRYAIAVNNHSRPNATDKTSRDWQVVFDGDATAKEIRKAANILTDWFRYVVVFRGKNVGKLWYEPTAERK